MQAELPPPPFAYYKDFELTEDGIGLMRYLEDTVDRALAKQNRRARTAAPLPRGRQPILCFAALQKNAASV